MDPATFLIVGANGQLGRALQAKYPAARAVDIDALDISNADAVQKYAWDGIKVILNAAAYTNVDGAETPEGAAIARAANADAPANLAAVATERDMLLVHISTDYVFDGTKSPHTEDEPFSALSVYGKTKAAGDQAVMKTPKHYILRTCGVIGKGKNFVLTMLNLAKAGTEPTVVADQIIRPTFTGELVRAIDHLLTTQPPFGTYNLTNGGDPVNWADLARAAIKTAGLATPVHDTTTQAYFASKPGVAPRPMNSIMDLHKIEATGFTPTDWRTALTDYIKEEWHE